GDVGLDVAGGPGKARRLLAQRPRDLDRRLVERGEELVARPEHHVIEREVLLRRVDQQDADPHPVGQLRGAVEDERGPLGEPDGESSACERARLVRNRTLGSNYPVFGAFLADASGGAGGTGGGPSGSNSRMFPRLIQSQKNGFCASRSLPNTVSPAAPSNGLL